MADRAGSGDNSGAYQSFLFIEGSAEETAHLAELRRRLGDEAVDLMLRNRELTRDPRPLTDGKRAVLDAAMAPVLRDLRAAGALVPEVRYEAWEEQGPDYVSAFIAPSGIAPPGRTFGSQGVRVTLAQPAAERVAALADQVQDGRSRRWRRRGGRRRGRSARSIPLRTRSSRPFPLTAARSGGARARAWPSARSASSAPRPSVGRGRPSAIRPRTGLPDVPQAAPVAFSAVTPHWTELSHVLRVRFYHLVQSIQDHRRTSADGEVVTGGRTLRSTTFP